MAPKKYRPPSALNRVLVEQLDLTRVQGEYRLTLTTSDRYTAEMRSDDRLGCVMSAWSVALKGLAVHQGKPVSAEPTRLLTGNIVLSYYAVRPVEVWPYAWRIVMHGHGFSYTCNVDRDLEHVILAYQGAMKFFATKLGLTQLDDEVIRNVDAAAEVGLLDHAGGMA